MTQHYVTLRKKKTKHNRQRVCFVYYRALSAAAAAATDGACSLCCRCHAARRAWARAFAVSISALHFGKDNARLPSGMRALARTSPISPRRQLRQKSSLQSAEVIAFRVGCRLVCTLAAAGPPPLPLVLLLSNAHRMRVIDFPQRVQVSAATAAAAAAAAAEVAEHWFKGPPPPPPLLLLLLLPAADAKYPPPPPPPPSVICGFSAATKRVSRATSSSATATSSSLGGSTY